MWITDMGNLSPLQTIIEVERELVPKSESRPPIVNFHDGREGKLFHYQTRVGHSR